MGGLVNENARFLAGGEPRLAKVGVRRAEVFISTNRERSRVPCQDPRRPRDPEGNGQVQPRQTTSLRANISHGIHQRC